MRSEASAAGREAPPPEEAPSCPACLGRGVTRFFEARGVPVLCNVPWPTPDRARAVPRGDVDLGACRRCGMIWNLAFDPSLLSYGEGYENSLHFSPRFRAYAEELATRLVDRYGLRGRDVIELGCGRGDFLALLAARGIGRGTGFDPGHGGGDGGLPRNVRIVPDVYGEAYADLPVDLIVCRHTLEHVPRPRDFLAAVRRAIGRRGTEVFFEVPNAHFTLGRSGLWDVLYEHCSYFRPAPLARLFREAGFRVRSVRPAFDGQFLCVEAAPDGAGPGPSGRGGDFPAGPAWRYAAIRRSAEDAWAARLRGWRRARRVVVWGAGSKGVMFLNSVDGADSIPYVVDVNPRKQGRFVSGTGHPIVAPAFVREHPPDVVLVMNPVYEQEIRDALAGMGVAADVEVV